MPPDSASGSVASDCTKVLQGRYELGRLLGRGASSKVYHARDVRTGAAVAVKAIRKPPQPCAAAQWRRSVEQEVLALRRLAGHPHVVRLHDVLASRSNVYLVLDLARRGSLLSALERHGRADEAAARRLFRQLAAAVAHAHARGVFHRDVKPDNVLLDDRGDAKLTDFGLCAFAGRQLGADGLVGTACGTPSYVAPEVLRKKRYDAGKADVWSCGVVLFVLTAGYLPFNDANLMAMYRKICAGKFRCPRWCSPELRHLIGRMLDPEPDTRIKIGDILDDPWFGVGLHKLELPSIAREPDSDTRIKIGDILNDPWFGVGLCEVELLPIVREPNPEVIQWEAELEEIRELNAFDIISFASGCDLTGLIGLLPDRVRFAVSGPAGLVLDRMVELGREEELVVRRKEKLGLGGVLFEGRDGKLIVKAKIYQLAERLLMVEAERAIGAETPQFWERLKSALSLYSVHLDRLFQH